ncbi:MAG: ankyrin repeat domain-containing protein [Candidatus Micrarchaeota archaeon]|nr:ankyrin repeat domain-containing protein [Candidatus Micrarchaeota archaeon]
MIKLNRNQQSSRASASHQTLSNQIIQAQKQASNQIEKLLSSDMDTIIRTIYDYRGSNNRQALAEILLTLASESHLHDYDKVKKILLCLIDAKVDLNQKDIYGNTALIYFAQYLSLDFSKFSKLIKILLDADVNVNIQSNDVAYCGMSALHIVCEHAHQDYQEALQLIGLMIKKGADVNLKDDHGNVPRIYLKRPFIFSGNYRTYVDIKKLLEGKIQINLDYSNLSSQPFDAVKAIRELDAGIHRLFGVLERIVYSPMISFRSFLLLSRSKISDTAREISCFIRRNWGLIHNVLFIGGLYLSVIIGAVYYRGIVLYRDFVETTIASTVEHGQNSSIEKEALKELLLKTEFNVNNFYLENEDTLLIHYVKKNDLDMVKFLVEQCNADVTVPSYDDKTTALAEAIKTGNKEMIDYLMKQTFRR